MLLPLHGEINIFKNNYKTRIVYKAELAMGPFLQSQSNPIHK